MWEKHLITTYTVLTILKTFEDYLILLLVSYYVIIKVLWKVMFGPNHLRCLGCPAHKISKHILGILNLTGFQSWKFTFDHEKIKFFLFMLIMKIWPKAHFKVLIAFKWKCIAHVFGSLLSCPRTEQIIGASAKPEFAL